MKIDHHRYLTESVLILNILRLEIDIGTALRQRGVVARKTEEKLRDTCDDCQQLFVCSNPYADSLLTMPPITDYPATEFIASKSRAIIAVPLQSSGVDGETMTTNVRTVVAKVDAHRLPAGVGDLVVIQGYGPAVC
jgi:hypothetical protein